MRKLDAERFESYSGCPCPYRPAPLVVREGGRKERPATHPMAVSRVRETVLR